MTKVELRGTAEPKPPAETKNQPTPLKHGSLDLRIHGSNTIGAKLAPEIARAYAEKNGLSAGTTNRAPVPRTSTSTTAPPKATANISSGLRRTAPRRHFRILLGGATDIGMSSRRIKDEEVKLLKDAGLGDLKAPKAENVIALDGVAVIVNKANPVELLSLDQIARIFSGEIRDWGQVGGTPGLIVTYSRDKKSGTFDTFKSLVMEGAPKREMAASTKPFESSEELSDWSQPIPAALGLLALPMSAARKQSAFQRVVDFASPLNRSR